MIDGFGHLVDWTQTVRRTSGGCGLWAQEQEVALS
jgi:hypothetical protein